MVSMKSVVEVTEKNSDASGGNLKFSNYVDKNNNHIDITFIQQIPIESVFDTHCHFEFIQKRMLRSS